MPYVSCNWPRPEKASTSKRSLDIESTHAPEPMTMAAYETWNNLSQFDLGNMESFQSVDCFTRYLKIYIIYDLVGICNIQWCYIISKHMLCLRHWHARLHQLQWSGPQSRSDGASVDQILFGAGWLWSKICHELLSDMAVEENHLQITSIQMLISRKSEKISQETVPLGTS